MITEPLFTSCTTCITCMSKVMNTMSKVILKKSLKKLPFAKGREQERFRILTNPRTALDQRKDLVWFFLLLHPMAKRWLRKTGEKERKQPLKIFKRKSQQEQVPMTGLQFLKSNFIAKQLSWVPKKCSKGPSFPLFLPSFLPFLSFQRLKTKPVCHTCDSETKQKRSKSI